MVSAKANNLSVHSAIQKFLRQILEKDHHLERKWRASQRKAKEKKQRYEFKASLAKAGIDEVMNVFMN